MNRTLRAITALAAALVVALAAAPASAEPSLRSERVFFHCGTTRVQALDYVQDDAPATWNVKVPTASVQDGAGCGQLDTTLTGTTKMTPYDATFSGTFTGNLQELTVSLFSIPVDGYSFVTDPGPQDIEVRMAIDGKDAVGTDTTGAVLTITPVPTNGGATWIHQFTVTGIGLDGEAGSGEAQHKIDLMVGIYPIDAFEGWVWDTKEVPAGILFNPPSRVPTMVTATPPAPDSEPES
jgi:hypothetical protein